MTHPYQDPNLSVEERVNDLLGRLSIEEKAGQVTQYFYFKNGFQNTEMVERDGHRISTQAAAVEDEIAKGHVGSLLFVRDPAEANRLQRKVVAGSRHGIPAIFGFDVIHGMRTVFPVPLALAATWHPETIAAGQAVAAKEARAIGIHWAFAPMVDIARDPRWGRIIEGAGEDPVLGAAVAAAQVRGFQGGAELGAAPGHILAGPKHFAGYGAARGGRDYEESEISDSELWNVYLPPFKAAVDAGAANIMSAYMDLNGVPATGNRWLLTDVLRDDFGFKGFVVSDANAAKSLEVQHFASDATDASARALHAGLDMEMAIDAAVFARLPEAIAAGKASEAELDQAVRRVLEAKFRLGLFENPFVDESAAPAVLNDPAHREASRVTAEKTLVLLKNRGVLPFGPNIRRIAVLGPLADSKRDHLGPWIFDYDVDETVTIAAGIKARAGKKIKVSYAPGVLPGDRKFASMFDAMEAAMTAWPKKFDEEKELKKAVKLAKGADVAVVVVGQPQNQIGEKASTSTLDLPGHQLELLKRVVATGTPTVALVMSGRPLDLRWAAKHVPAIVQVWYPGSRGGEAVANMLFGDVSPAGRLPITWPRSVGQLPMVYSHYRTFQPEEADKRYWDEESTPLFPFGHGLSYASFTYSDLRLSRAQIAVGGSTTVRVDVQNTSDRAAEEVVQLYIHQRHGEASRPIRELKGFERLEIPAGLTRTVEFELGPEQLRYWSAASRQWVQDATTIDIWVGGSSAAELGTVLTVN